MSTVVFVGKIVPEKRLVDQEVYNFHPDSKMKEEILKDLKKHLSSSLEDVIIDLEIRVTLKRYDNRNS